ncbi:MAG: hypothetical protein WDN23_11030 [Edaphobacter sp.]
MDWADEEGARFGRSLFGSSAFAGTHNIAADRVRLDRDGVPLEDALRRCDVDIERIGDAGKERANAGAYLELHIEQGAGSGESGAARLAWCLARKGWSAMRLLFMGRRRTPDRRRWLCGEMRFAACCESLRLRFAQLRGSMRIAVATMGSVKTFPGIVTAVVGRCETTLDMRDLDPGVLASMLMEAREASERFAAEERLHCRVVEDMEHRADLVRSAIDCVL